MSRAERGRALKAVVGIIVGVLKSLAGVLCRQPTCSLLLVIGVDSIVLYEVVNWRGDK